MYFVLLMEKKVCALVWFVQDIHTVKFMQLRQEEAKDTSHFSFRFVFTATPKIKHSKGRSDTMSEGGEGKLSFVAIMTLPSNKS